MAIMPVVNFIIASGKYVNLPKAISAYNEAFPLDPATNEDDFCKRASLEALQDYLTRYRNARLAKIADKIAECTDEQWNTVTGTLG